MPHHANAGVAAQPREMIGEGTFGKVYLVRCSSTGKQVVLKESETIGLSDGEKEAMLNEALILKRLQHPAIIAYRQAYIRGDMFCIEMDWAAGGDLRSFITKRRNEKQWLAETTVARHLWQLTSALAYCHKQNLLHRDLKTANIFLDALDQIKVRIRTQLSPSPRLTCSFDVSQLGDFGISKILSSTQARPGSSPTPLWRLCRSLPSLKPLAFVCSPTPPPALTCAPATSRPRPRRNVAPRFTCRPRCARACRTPARRTSGHSGAYSSS